jgi:TonB family protein
MIPLKKGLLMLATAVALYPQSNTNIGAGMRRPDGAYEVGNGVSHPTAVFRSNCDMPDLARKLRLRGDVELVIVVRADGKVSDIEITKPAGYGMDESATACIRNWRFSPGTKDGEAVDVAFPFKYTFSLVPQPKKWGAGPIIFAPISGTQPPTLKSAAISDKEFEPTNQTVLLQFTVSPNGRVEGVNSVQGDDSDAVSLLTKSLSAWRFIPASGQAGPIAASGKVLFIKGQDYFRYKVSSEFKDSGSVASVERGPAPTPASSASASVITIRVPITVELGKEAAEKQLIHKVAPQYPEDAKTAGIQGDVSLMIRIGKDGSIKDVKAIAGPPQLISAAIVAVNQWRYQPTLVKGEPQEASTVVDIPFKLFE